VRLTVQGRFEADACMKIRETLWEKGCDVPLVADIHFAPAVALRVADAFEKVHMVIWMRLYIYHECMYLCMYGFMYLCMHVMYVWIHHM